MTLMLSMCNSPVEEFKGQDLLENNETPLFMMYYCGWSLLGNMCNKNYILRLRIKAL